MSSLRRIISSRTNGALSHGPVTEEGKRRSSLNAVRHGLLSRQSVIELEATEIFDTVLQDHMDCFEPEAGAQEGIVTDMVSDHWRMHRLRAIETRMMNRAIAATSPEDSSLDRITDAFCALADTHRYTLLNIYEGRLHRRYHNGLHAIIALTQYREKKAEKQNGQTNPL